MKFSDFDIFLNLMNNVEKEFSYSINNNFFALFNYSEFYNSDIGVSCTLKKTDTFQLSLTCQGTVTIDCDITNEPFDFNISNKVSSDIQYGSCFDDSQDTFIVPQNQNKLNIAQYIYETILLAIPMRRVNPLASDKTLEPKTPLKRIKNTPLKQGLQSLK